MTDLRIARRVCKANYGTTVKTIVSAWGLHECGIARYTSLLSTQLHSCGYNDLDKSAVCAIIIWTSVELSTCGGHYVELKDLRPCGAGNTQCSSGTCHGRALCHKRLLRPKRHGAGQIRDASQSACGRRAAIQGGESIRVFSHVVLQHSGGVRTG